MNTHDSGRGSEPAQLPATTRLYWEDDHCLEADATVIAVRNTALAFDRTCFYPGGGGQPADSGWVRLPGGAVLDIVTIEATADEVLWHIAKSAPPSEILGQRARLVLDEDRRLALTRYHTVLHVVNTIALRDYAGWITGVQIAVDYSRIDFKLDGFSAGAVCGAGNQGQCRPGSESCLESLLPAGRGVPPARRSAQDARGQAPGGERKGAGRGDRGVRCPGLRRDARERDRRVGGSRSSAPRTRARSTSGCTSDSNDQPREDRNRHSTTGPVTRTARRR